MSSSTAEVITEICKCLGLWGGSAGLGEKTYSGCPANDHFVKVVITFAECPQRKKFFVSVARPVIRPHCDSLSVGLSGTTLKEVHSYCG